MTHKAANKTPEHVVDGRSPLTVVTEMW